MTKHSFLNQQDSFIFTADDDASTTFTTVVIADADIGAALFYVVEGVPTHDTLTKLLAEGAFGEGAVAVLDSISGPAEEFTEMLSNGFNESVLDELGFEADAIGNQLEKLELSPPSSQEAFEKKMAEREDATFQDNGVDELQTGVGLLGIAGGLLAVGAATTPVGVIGGAIAIVLGAISAAKGASDDHTSTEPETGEGDETEDETIVASIDEDSEVDDKDDKKPEVDENTAMPHDPNTDGGGNAGAEPPEETDPNEGTTDPQDDDEVFLFVEVESGFEEDLAPLILNNEGRVIMELPDIDPMQLEETTQPGTDGQGVTLELDGVL